METAKTLAFLFATMALVVFMLYTSWLFVAMADLMGVVSRDLDKMDNYKEDIHYLKEINKAILENVRQ